MPEIESERKHFLWALGRKHHVGATIARIAPCPLRVHDVLHGLCAFRERGRLHPCL